jgi:transcriptional regulator with GAF, ATPase, and Fis domain
MVALARRTMGVVRRDGTGIRMHGWGRRLDDRSPASADARNESPVPSRVALRRPRRGGGSREEIAAALERHAGVRERVWRELGLANRYVLKRLMKKHGLLDAEEG